MKLLDFKKKTAVVAVENQDDLWHLSQCIEKGDLIKGKTERKIRFGGDERKSSVEKKIVFLEIEVEQVNFSANLLRVSGKVTQGTEEVPSGSYHTFSLEDGSKISITKKEWYDYQVRRLKEACVPKKSSVLICVHDRDTATFALLKPKGYEILSTLSGSVEKKAEKGQSVGDFYAETAAKLKEYEKRYDVQHIIVASPAFFKEDFLKKIEGETAKKIVIATCSYAGKEGVQEVIKREEVKNVLKSDRTAQEMLAVEKLLSEIAKGGKAAYGRRDVQESAEKGAVELLLVADSLIKKEREEGTFDRLENMMKMVEQMKGEVRIISVLHDAGKKLEGLGGIGAILRY